ncbi:Bax inhibitor-1/YccA family protein [Bacillus sp. 165]|uniref:Bax inhibitor-1/YccA family protein n=1 Tax=Bacillus sp. 165 TaxID=1529117 RepID=UPI001ADD3989|nr:Bax inhibitor-1/YccA family protein [Bacillus sp. 165]MBO9129493.1 Bax inhibitor-1/YccA family protein [Bacillus sp. 165]
MRTTNPILKDDAFRKTGASGNAMTIGGTVGKAFIMLLLLLGTAVFSYVQVMANKMNLTVAVGSMIVALILGMVTSFVPRFSPVTAPVYAAVEGVILGTVSALYTIRFGDNIVLQAVLLTVSILLGMLAIYAFRIVKVTNNFRMGVMAATMGVFIMYLVVFVLQLFGVAVPFLHQGGTLGIIISAVIIVIASLNLVLDFDFIENGARYGSPKYMEWYGAFGLMVTLIWLYFEILRLLSYFTRND